MERKEIENFYIQDMLDMLSIRYGERKIIYVSKGEDGCTRYSEMTIYMKRLYVASTPNSRFQLDYCMLLNVLKLRELF